MGKICCLCREEYDEFGNNAMPLMEGRCCDECNNTKVLPFRVKAARFFKMGDEKNAKC